MDDTQICPNCGETNPIDMAFCHSCQWRLKLLDDEWSADRSADQADALRTPSGESAAEESVPDWLRQLPSAPPSESSADETLAEQLRARLDAQDSQHVVVDKSQHEGPEDLLAGLTHSQEPDDEPIPDWVARIMGITESDDADKSPDGETDVRIGLGESDYSKGTLFGRGEGEPAGQGGDLDARFSLPPVNPSDPIEVQADAADQGRERDGIYAWLRQLDADNVPPPAGAPGKDVPATTDVPTWVGRMLSVTGQAAPEPAPEDKSLPDWLASTSLPDELPSDAPLQRDDEVVAPPEAPQLAAAEPSIVVTAESSGRAPDTNGAPSAPAVSQTDSLDVDAVFAAMEMPPWAAGGESPQSPGFTDKPPAAHSDLPVELADLPSWVQAMRPVESAAAAPEAPAPELPLELGGPLLGLAGVLPAPKGMAVPSSHPKPHDMKPEVSDRQRAHVRMLEEMLDAETRPLPRPSAASIGSPRALRWLIGFMLLASIIVGLVSGSTAFMLPASVPTESNAAIQVVQNLPPDLPVLAVFDYEPATAGEMEVTAASIMDNLLLLKHPRLVLLSTSPTGSALAGRFLSSTLHERGYVRGQQYVDLGYLPGGLSGVQYFAQDPAAAMPFGAATDRVWGSDVLLGTTGLQDFSAIVVLTDSLESGSVWIEQTTARRGAVPLLIVASAQAGPMLLPYFDSGQIQGLVVGMNGAVATELANGGRPGLVRRYWDAYNLGLYAAAMLIALGATWQGVSRLRRRPGEAA
jgi:hypothetical protein